MQLVRPHRNNEMSHVFLFCTQCGHMSFNFKRKNVKPGNSMMRFSWCPGTIRLTLLSINATTMRFALVDNTSGIENINWCKPFLCWNISAFYKGVNSMWIVGYYKWRAASFFFIPESIQVHKSKPAYQKVFLFLFFPVSLSSYTNKHGTLHIL